MSPRAIGPSLTQVPKRARPTRAGTARSRSSFVTVITTTGGRSGWQEARLRPLGSRQPRSRIAIDARLTPGRGIRDCARNANTSCRLVEVTEPWTGCRHQSWVTLARGLRHYGDGIVIAVSSWWEQNDDRVAVARYRPQPHWAGVPNALSDPTLELGSCKWSALDANTTGRTNPPRTPQAPN